MRRWKIPHNKNLGKPRRAENVGMENPVIGIRGDNVLSSMRKWTVQDTGKARIHLHEMFMKDVARITEVTK